MAHVARATLNLVLTQLCIILVILTSLYSSEALQRVRGWDDVDEELSEMREEDQSERTEGRLSILNLLSFRSLRWQLISIIIMNMGQQLSGVNAVSVGGLPVGGHSACCFNRKTLTDLCHKVMPP